LEPKFLFKLVKFGVAFATQGFQLLDLRIPKAAEIPDVVSIILKASESADHATGIVLQEASQPNSLPLL
jgi:hypothetical protein